MNIAYLVDSEYWDEAAQYTLDLACAMKRLGHGVVVCVPKVAALEKPYRNAGLDTRKNIFVSLPTISMGILANLINKSALSIVHVNSVRGASIAVRAAELSGRADVRTVFSPFSFDTRIDSPIVKSVLESIDGTVLPVSDYEKYFSGTCRRIFVNRYAVPAGPVSRTDGSEGALIVTVNGRITTAKRIEQLLEAVAQIGNENIRIRIIGEGFASHVMPLKQTAQRVGLADRVEWRGIIDEYRTVLGHSAVAVELSGIEGLYRVAEYIEAGVPVIAMRDEASEQYIADGENGVLLDGGAVAEQLPSALRTVLTDPSFRIRFDEYRAQNPPRPYADYVRDTVAIYSGLAAAK